MAIKNYLINDKWLDIDKQNIVEVKSTDGVIGSVKVNGEEYGGGGGESDFSTAVLSIVDEDGYPVNLNFATLTERGYSMGGYPNFNTTKDLTVILYKGTAMLELENLNNVNISVSGAIEDIGGNRYAITGDCTITIS